MNKLTLKNFLLEARTKTYAGNQGKTKPVLRGSKQLEHKQRNYLYRDIYYVGNGIFMGLEVVHLTNKPVWAMSYYGNFKKATEKEIDQVLRKALIKNWKTTRLWEKVEWKSKGYGYIYEPDFKGSIEEMAGAEKIFKNNKEIYFFFCAGGLI